MTDQLTKEISNAVSSAVGFQLSQLHAEYTRPSVVMRPDLRQDGNAFIALYGENLQIGVVGTGASPAEAMADFDSAWLGAAQLPPPMQACEAPRESGRGISAEFLASIGFVSADGDSGPKSGVSRLELDTPERSLTLAAGFGTVNVIKGHLRYPSEERVQVLLDVFQAEEIVPPQLVRQAQRMLQAAELVIAAVADLANTRPKTWEQLGTHDLMAATKQLQARVVAAGGRQDYGFPPMQPYAREIPDEQVTPEDTSSLPRIIRRNPNDERIRDSQ